MATMMLASSAGWIAYSHVAVTDLPLAAFFVTALLAGLLRLEGAGRWAVWVCGGAAGLALLAKGAVAGVLLLPLIWFARKQWKDLVLAGAAAVAVAGPWYAAVTWVNGWAFIDVFFVRHHLSRFASEELSHVQPFWFYLPVMLGLMFPWTTMAVSLPKVLWEDKWTRAAGVSLAFGFVFFSFSADKLPGYVLPLLPVYIALLATAAVRHEYPARSFGLAGLLASIVPVAGAALPGAMLNGLSRTELGGLPWQYLAVVVPVAAVAWVVARRGRVAAAVAVVSVAMLCAAGSVKLSAWPVLDEVVSARGLYRRVQARRTEACVESLHRGLRYGLNYYTRTPLPDCELRPMPVRITQSPGGLPSIQVVEHGGVERLGPSGMQSPGRKLDQPR